VNGVPDVEAYIVAGDRKAARIDGVPAGTAPRPVADVAVIGAGTMGGGIALCAANAGLPVTIVEQSAEALERGLGLIRRNYAGSVERGRLTGAEAAARLACIRATTDYAAVASADLVIEAVFEDMAVKETVFRTIDDIAKTGAVLASNTSTLDLDRIAAFTRRPADVVGLHFFSPANVMRLLEIVRGAATAPDVLVTAMEFAGRIGKVGVVAGVCDGFIGNRMFGAYLRQAGLLLDLGVLPSEVDRALEAWGMAMGPFATMDLSGNDVCYAIRKRQEAEGAGRPDSEILDRVAEMGRYGQKTGAGFYRYDSATRARTPDPEIDALVLAHARGLGFAGGPVPDEEIVSRCVLALVSEGVRLLQEGIAQRASDIDVVYRHGYGFPKARGGPMLYADAAGLRNVIASIGQYGNAYRGELWQAPELLLKAATAGRCLHEI